jgi:hypothetical protein
MSRVEGCETGSRAVFALMCPLLAALFWFTALTPCALLAQTGAAKAPLSANRCLLVVETSRAMQRRSDGVVQAVQHLLKSGFAGQLRVGDTLGVWTYNESLYAGRFPLQTWSPEAQEGITSRTVGFLKEQKYEKQPIIENVLPALSRLIKDSPLITIILISSAEEKIHGTPFDAQINEFYLKWQDAQQKARMPFVVVLRARDGRLADYTVNTPLWPVQMPRLSQEAQSAEAGRAQVPKAAPASPPPTVQPLILSGKKTQPEEVPAPKVAPPGVTGHASSPATEGASANKALAATPLAPPATPAQIAKAEAAPVVPDMPAVAVPSKPATAPLPILEPKMEIAKAPEIKPIASPPTRPEPVPAPIPAVPEPKPAARELPKPAPAPESPPAPVPKPVAEPKVDIAKVAETKPIAPAPLKAEAVPAPPTPVTKQVAVPASSREASFDATAARLTPAAPSAVPSSPVQTAAVTPAGTLVGCPVVWIAGLVLAGVATGFVFLLRRRSHAPPGASLITQSFERKNKP